MTDFDDYNKQKRAIGSSGLFPFPRVGRSDPSLFSFEYDSPYSFGPYENYDGEWAFFPRQSEISENVI